MAESITNDAGRFGHVGLCQLRTASFVIDSATYLFTISSPNNCYNYNNRSEEYSGQDCVHVGGFSGPAYVCLAVKMITHLNRMVVYAPLYKQY